MEMTEWRQGFGSVTEGNMDALVRHDGAEIDKWMFRSAGRDARMEGAEWM